QVQRVAAYRAIDGGDVITGEVAGRCPGTDPQDSAQCVKDDKARPGHSDGPRDDPVSLAQPFDEPGARDDHAAIPVEETLGLVQPLAGNPHVLSEPQDQRAAAEEADRIADVVTGHRG